jgi:hypothetical protein
VDITIGGIDLDRLAIAESHGTRDIEGNPDGEALAPFADDDPGHGFISYLEYLVIFLPK